MNINIIILLTLAITLSLVGIVKIVYPMFKNKTFDTDLVKTLIISTVKTALEISTLKNNEIELKKYCITQIQSELKLQGITNISTEEIDMGISLLLTTLDKLSAK